MSTPTWLLPWVSGFLIGVAARMLWVKHRPRKPKPATRIMLEIFIHSPSPTFGEFHMFPIKLFQNQICTVNLRYVDDNGDDRDVFDTTVVLNGAEVTLTEIIPGKQYTVESGLQLTDPTSPVPLPSLFITTFPDKDNKLPALTQSVSFTVEAKPVVVPVPTAILVDVSTPVDKP